jgi:hypothetical protein
MAPVMPPHIDLPELVNTVADEFEQNRQVEVTRDGRDALIEPTLPYQDRVEDELRSGKITHQFLRNSVTQVLDNGFEIARTEALSSINGYVVRKSMKKWLCTTICKSVRSARVSGNAHFGLVVPTTTTIAPKWAEFRVRCGNDARRDR